MGYTQKGPEEPAGASHLTRPYCGLEEGGFLE